MPIHGRIFDNQIIAWLNQWAVSDHLFIHVRGAMIRIQHYHGAAVADCRSRLRDYFRIDARSGDVTDAGMLRPIGLDLDIDGDDSTMTKVIEEHGEVERTPAAPGSRFDHEIGASSHQHLLINPQVEWTLKQLVPEPTQIDG